MDGLENGRKPVLYAIHSDEPNLEAQKVRENNSNTLPARILSVLKRERRKINLQDLKQSIPESSDVPDSDWYGVLNDLVSDGLADAKFVRTGMDEVIRGVFNIEISSRGRALTPDEPIAVQPIKEGAPLKVVTRKGDCFEVTFRRKHVAHDRDGVFYLFHLNDRTDKNRGERLVSVYRFGPEQLYDPNFDTRIETVLLNTIRRAFDIGRLTFDGPYDPHTYTEILLQAEDFREQRAASGEEIQEFITQEAYWLGFRHNPNPGHPIQFDSPAELEYLGVRSTDVQRYVLLLGQRGLLEKVLQAMGRPTHKLIDAIESASNTSDDVERFSRMAIEEAKRSIPEPDGRIHPKVGVVIVKDGRVLAKAHRGEIPEGHAEFIALEKKLVDVSIVAATVYATLEPCTTRNHPKVPCAARLAERGVARVYIGMLDPNPDITGGGQLLLSGAGIETQLFTGELMKEVQELNRDFTREQLKKQRPKRAVSPGEQKAEAIRSSIGKLVTVTNRQSNSYWASNTVVAECTDLWVTLEDASSQKRQTFPLTQLEVSFDNDNNRLRIEIDRY
jgi:pyrimidine deaminase RibD-like protein